MRFREQHWLRVASPTSPAATALIFSVFLVLGRSRVQAKATSSSTQIEHSSAVSHPSNNLLPKTWQKKFYSHFKNLGSEKSLTSEKRSYTFPKTMPEEGDGIMFRKRRSVLPTNGIFNDTEKRHALSTDLRSHLAGSCHLQFSGEKQQTIYECQPLLPPLNMGKVGTGANSTMSNESAVWWFLVDVLSSRSNTVVINDAVAQWNVPPHVTDLRLCKQEVGTVASNAFGKLKKTLEILHLEHNRISYVARKAFSGLRKLRELDLSFNRLQSLPSCVFSALANLEFLSLKSNELEDVRERTLAGLNFLTFLDLSSNLLVDIHPDALNPLKGQRSVVIDVRRNRLRRPRKQWIAAAREQTYSCSSTFSEQTSHANARSLSYHAVKHAEASSNDRNQLENATSPLLLANSSESDKNFPSRKKRSLFTRVLWADKNLWDCSCSKSFDSFEFLQVVSSLSAFNTLSYSATKSSPSGCLEVLQENFVIVQQEKGYFSLWDITMSCDTPVELQGHSFASPFKVGPAMLQSCCSANRSFQTAHHRNVCLNVTNWITKSKANCTVVRPPESGLKESEVTIIGILIVVLVPVFLTLCPDCDRTVVPTQRMQYNSVVVGGTYVGGCAGNMNVCNNNVMRLPQVWTPNLDRDEVFEKPAAKETGV